MPKKAERVVVLYREVASGIDRRLRTIAEV